MTRIFNGSSQQSSLLSLLKAATGQRKNASAGQHASSAIMAMIEKSDPAKAKQLKEQQEKTGSILQQLQSMKSDQSAARKEAARQKVEQLKKQIQALRMMAAGDPKAAARRAAQLARELSSATKEYASAGGSNSELGGASVTPAVPTAASEAGVAPSEGAPSSAQATPPPAQSSAPVTVHTDDTASEEDTASSNASPDEAAAQPASARDEAQAKINAATQRQAEREADDKFSTDVRKLLNELKSIIKSAQQKMRADGGSGETQDIDDAQNALRDVEKSLGDIASGTIGSTFSAINVVV